MPLAAVGQFCATASIVANKSICIDLIKKAARQGASVSGKASSENDSTQRLTNARIADDLSSRSL